MKVLLVRTRGRKDGVGNPESSHEFHVIWQVSTCGDLLHPQRVPINAFWRLRHHEAKSKMKGRETFLLGDFN